MKKIKYLPLIAALITSTACASSSSASNNFSRSQFFGGWNCSFSNKEDGVLVSIDLNVNYIRNGSSNSFGTMTFKPQEQSEMEVEYSISSSGNWEYQDGYLIETVKEMKIVNLSHPELDEILNLENILPQNISESSEVLLLNGTTLKLKSESNGEIISCNKLNSNS